MTLPRLSVTDRTRLKELTLEQSQILPPGKVWFCRGRTPVLKTNLSIMSHAVYVPREANIICVSIADFEQVKEWIG